MQLSSDANCNVKWSVFVSLLGGAAYAGVSRALPSSGYSATHLPSSPETGLPLTVKAISNRSFR